MSRPAIRVEGISKLYRVGLKPRGYTTLREAISEACWAPVRRLRSEEALARRRGQRSEVRGRRSEVRGRRSEVRGRRSEVGSRKSAGATEGRMKG
jgi:hypothetical protein